MEELQSALNAHVDQMADLVEKLTAELRSGLKPAYIVAVGGVYLAERLNSFLAGNWRSFAGQNYFDPHGLFLSVIWSGPLLVIAVLILVNTLFSTCHLIVRWKRAELRHRARAASNKED